MTGDSFTIAGAVLLLAASGYGLRVPGYLRFGAALFAALAIAALLQPALAAAAALLVLPLGGTGLGLAALARFARPAPAFAAALLLAAALRLRPCRASSGNALYALLPLALAGIMAGAAALHSACFAAALSGVFLVAGACAFAARGAGSAVLLFLAAALLGLAQLRRSRSAARLSVGML